MFRTSLDQVAGTIHRGRAYIDQLNRGSALKPERIAAIGAAIDKFPKRRVKGPPNLRPWARNLEKEAAAAKIRPADADGCAHWRESATGGKAASLKQGERNFRCGSQFWLPPAFSRRCPKMPPERRLAG